MQGFTSRWGSSGSQSDCVTQYQGIGDGETQAGWDHGPFFVARDYRDDVDQIGLILTGNLNAFVHPDAQAGQVTVALGASRAVLPLTVAPAPACTDPAWQPTSIYDTGDVVSHDGHRWRAQWWTQSQEPGTTGQYGVWVDLGPC